MLKVEEVRNGVEKSLTLSAFKNGTELRNASARLSLILSFGYEKKE